MKSELLPNEEWGKCHEEGGQGREGTEVKARKWALRGSKLQVGGGFSTCLSSDMGNQLMTSCLPVQWLRHIVEDVLGCLCWYLGLMGCCTPLGVVCGALLLQQ